MRSEPVFMNTVATSCAGMSVHIERMTARSSAYSAVFAKALLTSSPLFPYFWKVKGEPRAISLPRIVLPSIRESVGFGSQVSRWEGAPWAKMWMTALALPAKWEGFGARGLFAPLTGAARRSEGLSRWARESPPMPIPTRLRNCRRVRK